MKRRARETFVLGAERVFDEAELDLRNEAEADHEPIIDPDHAAPVEPAISVQSPAGPPAGAGIPRADSPQPVRWFRRPRPSVVAIACAAIGGGAVLLSLSLGRGEQHAPQRLSAHAAVDRRSLAPPRSVRKQRREPVPSAALGRRRSADRGPKGNRDASASNGERLATRDPTPAEPAQPVVPPKTPPAPVPAASAAPVSVAAEPSAVGLREPVQSAAAVRQEFGP